MTEIFKNINEYVDEVEHEEEMIRLGKQRVNKRRHSHVQREEESVTSYGKVMVSQTIRPLAQCIQTYLESNAESIGQPQKAFTKLRHVEPEISALITAKHIINTITQHKPLTATAISLGGKIETEIALQNFKNLNPELYEAVKTDLDKRSWNYSYKRRKLRESAKRDDVAEWEEWDTNTKLQLGIRLVELMIEATGMIEMGVEVINRKRTKIIKQTAKTREWITNRNSFNELLNPEYLPTVMPPKQWTSVTGGGYWTKELPELDLVKQKNKIFKRELENFDMPEVYNAVNVMQSTGFKINTFVLDVMKHAWDNGEAMGGMPPTKDMPIPNKPHDIDTNPVSRKEWKKQAVICHTENSRMFSKRLLYAKILWEADKFKDYTNIYFPLQLDFRGRAYCVPAFLNYQGISGAKALLSFSHGKEITEDNSGGFWLAVHGANVWGNDKVTLEERAQWSMDEDNMAWIRRVAEDPISNREWEDADSPFQFLAWCDEWIRFQNEGYGFISYLPVAIDGSCNGLQLYSLMLKDKEAGKLVNVVPSDKPQDIYQLVADAVTERLKDEAAQGKEFAQLWLDYGVKRSTTKRSIMTICYGSTRYSCTDFVVEDLTKRKDKGEIHPFEDMFKPSIYLAGIIWESIGDNLKSARKGMAYLQSIAKVVSKEQLPIHWVTPVGFPVYQSYPEMKSKRVKAMLMGEVIKPRIKEETDKTDKLRMSNGVAPNFVHSLDSAAMIRTVNIANKNGVKNFCNVHDSFGTTAGDVEMLSASLKEAFIQTFTETDVLKEFKEDVKSQLPVDLHDKLPEELEKGDLDVQLLRECDYFFA